MRQKVGLAAAELTSAQRDLLWQLVETYAVAAPVAGARGGAAGTRRLRRSRGRALRLVRPEHAGEGVRLSGDRRWLRDRDGLGRRGRAAPAHDLPRPRQRALDAWPVDAVRCSATSRAQRAYAVLRIRDCASLPWRFDPPGDHDRRPRRARRRTGTSSSQQAKRARAWRACPMRASFRVPSFRFQWPADLLTSGRSRWRPDPRLVRAGRDRLGAAADGVRRAAILWHADRADAGRDRRPHRAPQPADRHARDLRAAGRDPDDVRLPGRRHADDRPDHRRADGAVRPSDLGVRSALVADTVPSRPADRRDGHLAHHDGLRAHRRRAYGCRVFAAFGMGPAYAR